MESTPRPNATKRALARGATVPGVFLPIPAPRLVELCGLAGFDYVIVDAEHGPIDITIAEDMCRAADVVGLTPMVRVPSLEPKVVLRYLDAGFQGVMFPQVNSAVAARSAVNSVRYPPSGQRGLGAGRAAWYGQAGSLRDFAARADEEILLIAQLEHVDALAELAEIVSTPGIDAFELGTADLSASFGHPGDTQRPEVVDAVDQFVRAVLAAGKVIGDSVATSDDVLSLIARGYRMVDCSFVGVSVRALSRLVHDAREQMR